MKTPQAVRKPTYDAASDADMELQNVDDRLHEEMQRLAAINQELLGNARPGTQESFHLPEEADELALLRSENAELRARVEELEELREGYQKKEYRDPENYKALFRDFNEIFEGVQKQRPRTNPANLKA